SRDSWRLLELGRDSEGQFVERRVQTALRSERDTRRVKPKILGLDETGQALWLCLEHGLFVLPLETLAPRLCLAWNDFREACPQEEQVEFQEVLMDLRTRELYVFFDHSLTMDREDVEEAGAESCRVLCLAPQSREGEPLWQVDYPDLAGEVVCGAPLSIDGFSDAFCILATHCTDRCLWALDADGGLWKMEL
ncbi:unnamed protein product, partial [Symbiodinium sp. KB8]